MVLLNKMVKIFEAKEFSFSLSHQQLRHGLDVLKVNITLPAAFSVPVPKVSNPLLDLINSNDKDIISTEAYFAAITKLKPVIQHKEMQAEIPDVSEELFMCLQITEGWVKLHLDINLKWGKQIVMWVVKRKVTESSTQEFSAWDNEIYVQVQYANIIKIVRAHYLVQLVADFTKCLRK
ncbi:hypothetical protein BDZ97DRAFT_1757739 [Flammula alnicola]|nr:hypothetical protein BDZ97DRAFT_1757739 [Flammula alnicola]